MIVKATIYGQEYSLVYDSSKGLYEAVITAPSDSSYPFNTEHYFPVSISATDEAGNVTTISDTQGDFKDNLKLYAKEQIKPTITEISPSNGAYIGTSNPLIKFTVLDNSNGQSSGFSGIDPSSISLVIGSTTIGASEITRRSITGGYECSYAPTSAITDGSCTITIMAADYDGNQSEPAIVTFTVDTIPPVLDVTSPEGDITTNSTKILVSGKTSDASASPVSVEIKVNGTSQGAATVSADGSFSKEVEISEGVNTVTIISTDKAGKSSSVTRMVTLKTTGPVFKTVTLSPNPVNCGTTYTITVTFEE